MDRRSFLLTAAAAAPALTAFNRASDVNAFRIEHGKVLLPHASVRGRPVRAALDTGASTSAISETMAIEIYMDRPGLTEVRTPTDRVRRQWGDAPLDLPGGRVRPRRVLILPDAELGPVDYVVGGGDLETFGLAFSRNALHGADFRPGYAELELQRERVPVARSHACGAALNLILDSGVATSTLTHDAATALLRSGAGRALVYDTAEGPRPHLVRAAGLRSGDASLEGLLFHVRPPRASAEARAADAVNGLVGLDAMTAGDWAFDYPGGRAAVGFFQSLERPWFGSGMALSFDRADAGRITGLARNGPAARAGLRLDDRIVAYNGAAVTPALLNAERVSGRPLQVVVQVDRRGAISELELVTEPLI